MRYRREIDGLRALAVAPVILFHAGVPGFSGGYVGVDIFFVISGYLITTLILDEMEDRRFSLVSFYERRARRILPALFLVVACCIPFARAWMDPWEYRDFTQSVGATALFASNIHFWADGSYFAPAGDVRPLLHTWSLGVEEQFYLVFPLFLILMWRFGRRAILWTVLAFLVAGLALAETGSRSDPNATFYLPQTRIWELDVGVVCALLRHRVAEMQSGLLSGLGLVLIGVAVLAFDEKTPFPSVYALVPTLGAGLVILFGGAGTATARLLSTAPLVAIGLVSYSAYLWHQPLFAFSRIRGLEGPWVTAILIAGTFLLAWLSWRFVERPFRGPGAFLSRRAVFGLGGAGSAAMVAVAVAALVRNDGDAPNAELTAYLAGVMGKPKMGYACPHPEDTTNRDLYVCAYDYPPHRRRIALFGDSHAAVALPAFRQIAAERGYDISAVIRMGCPPLRGAYLHLTDHAVDTCPEVAERQLRTVVDRKIDTVFLVARWSLYDGTEDGYFLSASADTYSRDASTYREEARRLFAATVAEYRARGAEVYVMLQVPRQTASGMKLYRSLYFRDATPEEARATIVRNSVSRADHLERQAAINALLAEAGIDAAHRIDVTDDLCDETLCPIGDPDHSLYADHDHLSGNGTAIIHRALARLPALGAGGS